MTGYGTDSSYILNGHILKDMLSLSSYQILTQLQSSPYCFPLLNLERHTGASSKGMKHSTGTMPFCTSEAMGQRGGAWGGRNLQTRPAAL